LPGVLALGYDDHAACRVGDGASDAEPPSKAIDERPETKALDAAANDRNHAAHGRTAVHCLLDVSLLVVTTNN